MINNRKGFWRAKLPRFHTKPNFCNVQIVIKSQPYTALVCYLKHALSSSKIHLAAAKSLEIIGHVTNCCKRPICLIGREAVVFDGASDEVARGRLVSLEGFSFSSRAKNEEWCDFSTSVSDYLWQSLN